jgi:hypothetical protein
MSVIGGASQGSYLSDYPTELLTSPSSRHQLPVLRRL